MQKEKPEQTKVLETIEDILKSIIQPIPFPTFNYLISKQRWVWNYFTITVENYVPPKVDKEKITFENTLVFRLVISKPTGLFGKYYLLEIEGLKLLFNDIEKARLTLIKELLDPKLKDSD